jgi:zinc transporter, ZIP family
MSVLPSVLTFTAIPVTATLLGGLVASFHTPSPQLRSMVQHFAAGVVFAAVATELIPKVRKDHEPLGLVVGFVIGVIVMLGIRAFFERNETQSSNETELDNPSSLIATVGIDVLIDGILIGVSFAAGERAGVLLTVALTLELLFLALSTAASLAKSGFDRGRVFATVTAVAGILVLGAMVGGGLLAGLTGFGLEVVLSFGIAALLYLVTEELLVEAHEVPETPLLTAMFFAGFLALFLLEMLL